jgi:ribonuclease P protein component
MLAQVYSLRGANVINEILKKGQKRQSGSFGVFFVNRKDNDLPKFAFVISRKISRLAVNRNRVKRAMSESVRRNVARVPTGIDFVFLAKKSIVDKSTDEIMREVQNFISNLEI